MQVIICYDICDNKVRYKLVKYLEKFAVRVQYSVFKAKLNEREIAKLELFAKNLLKENVSLDIIIKATGLTAETLDGLKL